MRQVSRNAQSVIYFALFLMVTLIALSSCSPSLRSDPWRYGPDTDDVQELLRSTVFVFAEARDKDPKGPYDGNTGSGFVVAVAPRLHPAPEKNRLHTLVMTAGHVCETKFFDVPVPATTVYVKPISGQQMRASVVKISKRDDVCFLDVAGEVGSPVRFSSYMPPLGGKALTAGAPAGIWGQNLGLAAEGRYGGMSITKKEEPRAAVGLMALKGSSGSPMTYQGRVFGMLVSSLDPGEYVAFLVPLHSLLREVHEIMPTWKDMPEQS